jgi:hypothetical protein
MKAFKSFYEDGTWYLNTNEGNLNISSGNKWLCVFIVNIQLGDRTLTNHFIQIVHMHLPCSEKPSDITVKYDAGIIF